MEEMLDFDYQLRLSNRQKLAMGFSLMKIDLLPDESILEIFSYLGPQELSRCLQVSRRFNRIAKDSKLWEKIELFHKDVPAEFIGYALR